MICSFRSEKTVEVVGGVSYAFDMPLDVANAFGNGQLHGKMPIWHAHLGKRLDLTDGGLKRGPKLVAHDVRRVGNPQDPERRGAWLAKADVSLNVVPKPSISQSL